jgi:hypothetical protein
MREGENQMKGRWNAVLAALGSLVLLVSGQPLRARAQDASSAVKQTTLWVDQETGEVFIRPGRGRVPMNFGASPEQIEQEVEERTEQRTQDAVRAAVAQTEAQERFDYAAQQKQLDQIKPAWTSYVSNFQNKFRIGALAYLDYGLYTHTAFGPYFIENTDAPGPYNNMYNSFDISRIYLNTYFTRTEDLTFRFTPEIYRATGTASPDRTGAVSGFASNLDGGLNVRMKYGYVQYSGLFDRLPDLKGGNVVFGAQQNPLITWEEEFTQYRFVYLSPWNFLGLSSSQIGLAFNGPLKLNGSEKTYLDYSAGVFDNGNYRNQEQSNTKQVMARITAFPFGSTWRYQGLGLTGFYNYGYGNVAPDIGSVPTLLKGSIAHFTRMAAILSYAAEQWNVLGEFDYGQNAFQLGNLYSGSGPLDAFGTPTGAAQTSGKYAGNTCGTGTGTSTAPCYTYPNSYGPQTALYQAFLNNGRTRQLGLDFLGHYHIPGTKLTAFGMYQWFMPNDNVNEDPLDFERFVAGISYQYNEYLRFALDSQNLLFYHNQMSVPISYADQFNYVGGSTFNGRKLPKTGSIPNTVPLDSHAFFLNMEFAY